MGDESRICDNDLDMRNRRRAVWAAYLAILLGGLALIALTWLGTINALRTEEQAAVGHANSELATKALLFENQVRRRLFAVDQTMRILEDEWERDPSGFDLDAWQRRARVISDPGVYFYVTNAQGIIQISSRRELVGVDVSSQEGFRNRAGLRADDGDLFIGAGLKDPVTQHGQIGLARRLDRPNGDFAGIIGLSYDTDVVVSALNTLDLGSNGMISLVGSRHGKIFASAGSDAFEPGSDIEGSPLLAAMQLPAGGSWTGAIRQGGEERMCALRPVMDRPLAVVLCVDPQQELASHYAWQRSVRIFAACITLFVLFIMAILTRGLCAARRREAKMGRDRQVLEEANAREAAARAVAEEDAAQLEAILSGITDGVSVVDGDMRLTQWNAYFSVYSGVPADILRVGVPMTDILRAQAMAGEFGPVDVEAEVARRIARLKVGTPTGLIERARPNGHILEMRRSPLPNGGFVTLYSDITERKKAEQALERAREIAEVAAADKSRFVAIVSHEIRTPLNTLLSALMMMHASSLPPSQRSVLDVARQSGDALLGLLDDILEMSRADAGQLALRPSVFALRPLLESVLGIFQDQSNARGVSLVLQVTPDVPDRLYTDAGRLRQVLMNLVSNAVKYSRPGQIVLEASTSVAGGRTTLRLAVRDSGPAIEAVDRERLFQPFSRQEQHGTTTKSGTGLGLVICQRLIALMGGEIGCREAPEDRNEFWVTVPVRPAPVEVRTEQPVIGRHRRIWPRTRILLVDDIAPNRAIIATLLRREGHKVDVAESGDAAVAAVRRAPYDLVLMDIFMPGMNGLDATRAVHGLGGLAASVPVVALTANSGQAERANCLQAGMKDMLTKPVDVPTLLEAIGRYAWPGKKAIELTGFEPSTPSPVAEIRQLAAPAVEEPRLAELRANLAPEMLADLVDQCLRDLEARLPALQAAVAAGEARQIEAEAHAMAGMAASYAMAALEIRLRRLMHAGRSADLAAARAAASGLDDDFARTEAAFRTLFPMASA